MKAMRIPRRKGPAEPVHAVRRTGQPDPSFNYELFNCNNFNIRYWSWNYRGCWPLKRLQNQPRVWAPNIRRTPPYPNANLPPVRALLERREPLYRRDQHVPQTERSPERPTGTLARVKEGGLSPRPRDEATRALPRTKYLAGRTY